MRERKPTGDLPAEVLDGVESDLNKLGTPPDNVFRRMIAEIRRRRGGKPRKPKETI